MTSKYVDAYDNMCHILTCVNAEVSFVKYHVDQQPS